MSIRALTVWVAVCDRCGADTPDSEIGDDPYEHGDRASLLTRLEAEGWALGEITVCPPCVAEAICAEQGHKWGRWQPPAFNGTHPLRWCARCNRCERRPMVDVHLPGGAA